MIDYSANSHGNLMMTAVLHRLKEVSLNDYRRAPRGISALLYKDPSPFTRCANGEFLPDATVIYHRLTENLTGAA